MIFHFSMKNIKASRIAPDGAPRFAASHLGLFCWLLYFYMSHKKDDRLIRVQFFGAECCHKPRSKSHVRYALDPVNSIKI